MANNSALTVDDVVVSKVEDGHLLLIVTPDPADRLSLLYRGNAWNLQYAVAVTSFLSRVSRVSRAMRSRAALHLLQCV